MPVFPPVPSVWGTAQQAPPGGVADGGNAARGDALEDALNSLMSEAESLDAAGRARLAVLLLEARARLIPERQAGTPWLRSKREAKEQSGDGPREELASPGKIPRRRITTARSEPQSASAAKYESMSAQSQRSPARAALLQAETLFLVFRFLSAPQLSKTSSVCSVWRASAADERLWMWLYLGSGLATPVVMPGSWRRDFVQKQVLTRNWIRGRHAASACHGHKEAITCLSVSGNVVVSGSDDMDLRLWDLREGARESGSGAKCVLRHVYSGHAGKVLCCCIVRGMLVSGSEDKAVKVWDLASGKLVSTLSEHTNAVLCMATDGKSTVYTGSADQTVCMWCLERMELVTVMKKHTQPVLCVAFSNTIDALISGGRDHDIGIWRTVRSEGGCTGKRRRGGSSRQSAAADDAAGEEWAGTGSRLGQGIPSVTSRIVWLKGHEAGVTCIETEAHMIATGSDDKSVRLWNALSGSCLRVLEPHGGPVSCIRIQGNLLLSGSFDGKVRLFDMLSGRCLRAMSGHENAVLCLTATQRVCVTGANDRNIRIWDFHDDSPSPIPASVANFKKNWGMPAPRPSACKVVHRNPRRATAPGTGCALDAVRAHASGRPCASHGGERELQQTFAEGNAAFRSASVQPGSQQQHVANSASRARDGRREQRDEGVWSGGGDVAANFRSSPPLDDEGEAGGGWSTADIEYPDALSYAEDDESRTVELSDSVLEESTSSEECVELHASSVQDTDDHAPLLRFAGGCVPVTASPEP